MIVLMGSGARDGANDRRLRSSRAASASACVNVRLFRPFAVEAFAAALPPTSAAIAVLDRTKEPGAVGEPLYLDVVAALAKRARRATAPAVASRASSAAATGWPRRNSRRRWSRRSSTSWRAPAPEHALHRRDRRRRHAPVAARWTTNSISTASRTDVVRAVFFGLGADGTVGANKNSIKIIGEETDNFAQGYFVYDSKKSGAMTISHLRFGPRPIRSPYLIRRASFVACHQFDFLEQYDVLELARARRRLPAQRAVRPGRGLGRSAARGAGRRSSSKRLRFYVIDAYAVAREAGMGTRINTIMQTCFFAISGVLPRDEAIAQIKEAIEKTYGKRGDDVVQAQFRRGRSRRSRPARGDRAGRRRRRRRRKPPVVADGAPDFVQRVTARDARRQGRSAAGQRVSASTAPGRWARRSGRSATSPPRFPSGTEALCIQCNKCALVCPHAAIRAKVYAPDAARRRARHVQVTSTSRLGREFRGSKYTIQVAPEDCTGCKLCVDGLSRQGQGQSEHKALDMQPQRPLRDAGARELRVLPRPARGRPTAVKLGRQERRSSCSRCSNTPAPAPAAARRRTSSC